MENQRHVTSTYTPLLQCVGYNTVVYTVLCWVCPNPHPSMIAASAIHEHWTARIPHKMKHQRLGGSFPGVQTMSWQNHRENDRIKSIWLSISLMILVHLCHVDDFNGVDDVYRVWSCWWCLMISNDVCYDSDWPGTKGKKHTVLGCGWERSDGLKSLVSNGLCKSLPFNRFHRNYIKSPAA